MKFAKNLLLVAIAMSVSSIAAANTKYVINMYGQHLKGQNTLKLKKMIRNQYGWVDLSNVELVKVRLVAKSKKGHGKAQLRVGQNHSYQQTVGGNPWDFHYEGGYDRVVFHNPSSYSSGAWQINLRGNFKVKKVVVRVRETWTPAPTPSPSPGHHDIVYKDCSSWDYQYNNCYVNQGEIERVTVSIQHSSSSGSCIEGFSWGYTSDRIWVKHGCRATFRVRVRSNHWWW